MIYLQKKGDEYHAYRVTLDVEKLNDVLAVLESRKFPKYDDKFEQCNKVEDLSVLIKGIINGDPYSLDVLLTNNVFCRYDNIIKRKKEEYKTYKNMLIGNRYSELRRINLDAMISIGEEIAGLEFLKYYEETIYRTFFNEIISAISFDETYVDEDYKIEYVKNIKRKKLKKEE